MYRIVNSIDYYKTIAGVIEAVSQDKVDRSGKKLFELAKASRLCVCTSNSTVLLETLAMNFPTIVFWDPKYNEIGSDAQPYIDLLVEAEILFFNSVEAAIKVNRVVLDVGDWWFSKQVQSARETFCERYALNSPDWVDDWVNILK